MWTLFPYTTLFRSRVSMPEPASDGKERAQRSLERLQARYRRLLVPDLYPCGTTPLLAKQRAELVAKAHDG
jgi:hypothetical protein